MKKQSKIELVALATLIGVAGATTYMLMKTYKSLKGLDNMELDLGNDVVLSSIFKKG